MNTDKTGSGFLSVFIGVHPWLKLVAGPFPELPPSWRTMSSPMPSSFRFAEARPALWGGPPGPRGTPPSRRALEESITSRARKAGQGAGCGRWRPPHNSRMSPASGKLDGVGLSGLPCRDPFRHDPRDRTPGASTCGR